MAAPRGIARIGDRCKGVCTAHITPQEVEGVIISGCEKSFINGRAVARIGDKVRSDCGHEGIIITGAPTAFFEGRPHARLGDQFKGDFTGQIITASGDGY